MAHYRRGLDWNTCAQFLAGHFWDDRRAQRAGCFHRTAQSGLLSSSRREKTPGGEERRPNAGQGMDQCRAPDESLAGWLECRLGPYQVVDRWFVLEGAMLAIGCDGAVDQTRVERGEPVGMDRFWRPEDGEKS